MQLNNSPFLGKIIALWKEGSYPIALILLFASIFVPVIKFILILYLLISTKLNIYTQNIDKSRVEISAFALMVFFTLLSALAFDTRLIWEKKDATK